MVVSFREKSTASHLFLTCTANIRLKERGVSLSSIYQSSRLGIEGADIVHARGQEEKLWSSRKRRISKRFGIELFVLVEGYFP